MVTLVQGKRVTDYHAEREFDAKKIRCPICRASVGEQCPGGIGNHVDRARLSRWLQMGLIDLKEIEAWEIQEFGEKN